MGDVVADFIVGADKGKGVGSGVFAVCDKLLETEGGSFCAASVVCDELLETGDGGLGFHPTVSCLPKVWKRELVPLEGEGTGGFGVGLLPETAGEPMGVLVTENTPSKTRVASSAGEVVGSSVTGWGDGASLFSLHSEDQIASSLQ